MNDYEETSMCIPFHDVDSMKIVWHGNYVKYFEIIRERFAESNGIGYNNFFENGFFIPIVDLEIHYMKQLRYKEIVWISAKYMGVQEASLNFEYKIFNGDRDLICKGKTRQVITDLNGVLQIIKPDFVKEFEMKINRK